MALLDFDIQPASPQLGSDLNIFLLDERPDGPVHFDNRIDRCLNALQLLVVERFDLSVFQIVIHVDDPHQLRRRHDARFVERINAMVVFVAQPLLACHPAGDFENRGFRLRRRRADLCQPFEQINARSRRVQRQENDRRRFFVRVEQVGNQVDEQAFGVRPRIVQFAHQHQYVIDAGHRVRWPDPSRKCFPVARSAYRTL